LSRSCDFSPRRVKKSPMDTFNFASSSGIKKYRFH
jgi:hypothetical protein